MNTKTTLPISEARKQIFQIADNIQRTGARYTLTRGRRPSTVMMSAEEFDSWQETLEVMRDFPDLEKDIEAARDDLKKGAYVTLDDLLTQEGYVALEPKYETSSHLSGKGRRGSKKSR